MEIITKKEYRFLEYELINKLGLKGHILQITCEKTMSKHNPILIKIQMMSKKEKV